jgi:hypothetical protein
MKTKKPSERIFEILKENAHIFYSGEKVLKITKNNEETKVRCGDLFETIIQYLDEQYEKQKTKKD